MASKTGAAQATQSKGQAKVEPSKADKLAARAAKRSEDAVKAEEAKAKAEADAEKLAKAAEAEQAKAAEREIAEAAKAAEVERVAGLVGEGVKVLALVTDAEAAGLIDNAPRMWNLGGLIESSGLSAKGFAERAMVVRGDTFPVLGDDGEPLTDPKSGKVVTLKVTPEWIALAKAQAKANGRQWQPTRLSEHTDAANIRKAYASEAEVRAAAEAWAGSSDPAHASKSVRSFAKGENVNKAKRKGAPMTAKDAARLFAKAAAREGLSDEQAWAMISEEMEAAAE